MIVPVILAGGSGTRLWPLSRELYPKQLLPLFNELTMFQNTITRLSGMEGVADPIVVCSEEHRFFIAEQLRAIDVTPASIMLEPSGRNTAPAVTVAAMKALTLEKDPVLLVLPADHHIAEPERFHEAVGVGAEAARGGSLVTFGIVPSSPETGYGYIQRGAPVAGNGQESSARRIRRFVEKPDRERAEEFVNSGEYLWNSGMFMFLASSLLDEVKRLSPGIFQKCRESYDEGSGDLDFFRLEKSAFTACPSDSVDYAVMEKTEKGAVIPMDAGWSDVGSWDALWAINPKNGDKNVSVGDVVIQDARNCYLHATGRLIAALGIEDCVVVETPDAVLVAARDRAQDVKSLVKRLKDTSRNEACNHRKVYRPWGAFECVDFEQRFQVKRITVKPGARLSLQRHYHRAEHWIVVKGTAVVTRGGEQIVLKEDESTYIPLGFDHRLENPGKIPLEIIEVQTGSYLGEDDIVRLEDVYGRKD